jgi:hypothetical protein
MKLNDEPWGKTWDFGINYDEHILPDVGFPPFFGSPYFEASTV